jgi:hypothetical protein
MTDFYIKSKTKTVSLTLEEFLNISSYFHIDQTTLANRMPSVCNYDNKITQGGGGLAIRDWFACFKKPRVKDTKSVFPVTLDESKVEIPVTLGDAKVEIPLDILVQILGLNTTTMAMGMVLNKDVAQRTGYERQPEFFLEAFADSIWNIIKNEHALYNLHIDSDASTNPANIILIKLFKINDSSDTTLLPHCYFELQINTHFVSKDCFQNIRIMFHGAEGDQQNQLVPEIQKMMPTDGMHIHTYSNFDNRKMKSFRKYAEFISFLKSIKTPPSFYKILSEDIAKQQFSISNGYSCRSDVWQAKLHLLKDQLIKQQKNAIEMIQNKMKKYTLNDTDKSIRKKQVLQGSNMDVQGSNIKLSPRPNILIQQTLKESDMTQLRTILQLYEKDDVIGDDYRFTKIPDVNSTMSETSKLIMFLTLDDIYEKIKRNGYKDKWIECMGNLHVYINTYNNKKIYDDIIVTLTAWKSKETAPVTAIRTYFTAELILAINNYLPCMLAANQIVDTPIPYHGEIKYILNDANFFVNDVGDDVTYLLFISDRYFFPDTAKFIQRLYNIIDGYANIGDTELKSQYNHNFEDMKEIMNFQCLEITKNPVGGGKSKRYTKSSKTIIYKNKTHFLFYGARGGRYIKLGKEYKYLKTFKF